MPIKTQLRADLTTSLKAGTTLRTSVLRALIGAIEAKEKAGKTPVELDEAQQLAVLVSEAKTRRDSARIYTDANAISRSEIEAREAEVIEQYLPTQISDAALNQLVTGMVSALENPSMRDMGRVIKAIKAVHPLVDGKRLSELVRAALS